MIYGDYDVDGTTAVSLVYKFLQNYYSGLDYYIPDRYEEDTGFPMRRSTMPPKTVLRCSSLSTAVSKP